jgi:hypothetical protein
MVERHAGQALVRGPSSRAPPSDVGLLRIRTHTDDVATDVWVDLIAAGGAELKLFNDGHFGTSSRRSLRASSTVDAASAPNAISALGQ